MNAFSARKLAITYVGVFLGAGFVSGQERCRSCYIGNMVHSDAELFGSGLISEQKIKKSTENRENQYGKNPCQLIRSLIPLGNNMESYKKADYLKRPFDYNGGLALICQKKYDENEL